MPTTHKERKQKRARDQQKRRAQQREAANKELDIAKRNAGPMFDVHSDTLVEKLRLVKFEYLMHPDNCSEKVGVLRMWLLQEMQRLKLGGKRSPHMQQLQLSASLQIIHERSNVREGLETQIAALRAAQLPEIEEEETMLTYWVRMANPSASLAGGLKLRTTKVPGNTKNAYSLEDLWLRHRGTYKRNGDEGLMSKVDAHYKGREKQEANCPPIGGW